MECWGIAVKPRSNIASFGGVSVLLAGLALSTGIRADGAGARADGPAGHAAYRERIIDEARRALPRAVPDARDDLRMNVLDRLDQVNIVYLRDQGITDLTGMCVVEFVPPQSLNNLIAGGSVSFFFRYPTTTPLLMWVGE